MAHDPEPDHPERVFTLFEANQLIPQLQTHLSTVQRRKAVILQTQEDIRKASAQADWGGGAPSGAHYVRSLQEISARLHAIHELGVHVKDIDMGLCDFPHLREGRIVYLCWKLGEQEIRWWHETTTGYKDRCPLEDHA